ncbi:MAG: phage antirepressor KilAC domain-containing protein [Paraburkholderia fungorum]|nr:phage antirepressor KilAC domain-containing protein [Paraburkholderia fungorum]
MNALANSPTMSSREIAELVESRHDSVKRAIERLAEKGLVSFTPMVETSHEGAGARAVEVYRVGKRDSYVIVAQLSPEFTARLVDRWQELETAVAAPQLPDFTNPAIAARAWADQVEQRIALESRVEADAPKVEVYDRIAEAEGSICLRDAAKSLQIQPGKLNTFLQANGWIYRRVGKGTWTAYQDKLQAGLLIHKVTPYIDETNGESRVNEQVRITPRGLTRIAELLNKSAPSRARPPVGDRPGTGMH